MDTVIVKNSQFYSHCQKRIAKGNVNAEKIEIRLDSEWDGLTVRIHWLNVASKVEKNPLLERDKPNTIPWEVLADLGELRMGLVGLDGETVIKPTIWLTYGYVADGVDPESGSDPQPPTPNWQQQMVEQATQANQAAQDAKEYAQQVAESVESAGPYAEEAKKAAEAAKASRDAAATSAQQASAAARTAQAAAGSIGDAVQRAEQAAAAAGAAQQAAEAAQGAAAQSAGIAQTSAGTATQAAQEANSAATQAGEYLDGVNAAAGAATDAAISAGKSQEAAQLAAQEAGNAKDQATTAATAAQGHATAASTAKDAAEQAATTAGSAQSGAAQSAQSASNSAQAAERAKQEAQKAAAALPAPSQEFAGKVPVVNPEGNGYIFGEAGGGKIDDTTLGRDTTWSSRMIVDSLAPYFEASGPVVPCNPVSGYPLSVESQIVAVQSGSGDPSPENVRPISGWNEATIWKSGENLVNQSLAKNGSIGAEDGKLTINESASYGLYLSCDVNGDIPFLTFLGEYEGGAAGRWKICFTDNDNKLVPFSYAYNYPLAGVSTTFLDASGNSSRRFAVMSNFSGASKMWVCATDGRTTPPIITLVAGAVPDVAYSKYVGETIAVNFGQTVYGGTFDWASGLLTVDRVCLSLAGQENFIKSMANNGETVFYTLKNLTPAPMGSFEEGGTGDIYSMVSRTDPYTNYSGHIANITSLGAMKELRVRLSASIESADAFKAELARLSEAGTPFQVSYRIAEPFTVQLTPTEILALSGTNTIYTDTGDITVSGRADPNATIKDLLSRIDALEKAAIGGV